MDSEGLREQPKLLESNVLVLGLSSMLATFGNTLWFYFLPVYYSDVFKASPLQISVIYSIWIAVVALGSSPAGALADTYGRKSVIVFSSLVSAVAIFIFAISNNFLLSAIALPISGLGSSFFLVSNTLVAESVETRRRGRAFGTFSTMSSIAAAFSPIIGGLTISNKGYFPLFVIGGGLTLVAALVRILYLKETLPASERTVFSGAKLTSYFASARNMLGNRLLLSLVLVYSMYNLFADQNSFVPPLYARQVLKFDPFTLGILFSALLAAVALSRYPAGRLSDKIGRKRAVIISWVGEISVVYLFVFATSSTIAVIGIGLWMLFGVMDSPAINAWIAEASSSRNRGLSMGVFYTITFIPTIPALLVSGYLFSIEPKLPFYANSLVGLVALILLVGLTRKAGKDRDH
ncbi:MAG: MFS transporter [Nitrososphaerales archaeon]